MDLKEYFLENKGFGVLSTANNDGKVDSAAYAKPYVVDNKKVAFIMSDKLSYANLEKNPYAVYLFREETSGYEGKRLYIKKDHETQDKEAVEVACKAGWPGPYCTERFLEGHFLVYFTVEDVLPLVVYD